MQGSVNSPLRCSMTTDTLGKTLLSNLELSKVLYKFKGFLPIPPLSLVDDVLMVTKCGIKSLQINALAQSKFETKRLELGNSKCFQLHMGKRSDTCHSLMVDSSSWMERASKQRYLGDIVSTDSKIDDNINMRCNKSKGIKNEIISILKEVNLGHHYFELAFMLHSSLFINGVLFNTEALVNI